MKTKSNNKFVTNKRKKNKKLIKKSSKNYKNNNKNFSRKYRQKGGARVYDSIQRNKKPLSECLSNSPIIYDPKKHDYVPSVSFKSIGTVFSLSNPNCRDTFKYYNTAKLTFGELHEYLYFYTEYFKNFGKNAMFDLYKLGFLHIFHYLNDNNKDIPNLNFLFDSVSPILIECFVSNSPDTNFFWEYYYVNKTALVFRENVRRIESRIKGVDLEETRLPFKIKSIYTNYITLKNPFRLVKIFEDFKPYYSPVEYLGITEDAGNDIVSNELYGNEYKFKINNLEIIDGLYNNHLFIRKFSNVGLLTDSPLMRGLTNPYTNSKWDLTFDIPYDNTNLNVIHRFYNTNRDEDVTSFFKDTFIRIMEDLYIECNGNVFNNKISAKDNKTAAYLFLLKLSEPDSIGRHENNGSLQFIQLFDSYYDHSNLNFDTLRVILVQSGFINIELCIKNFRDFMKGYFLSKNPYLYNCLTIKTQIDNFYKNVYGAFYSYNDENNRSNGELQTNIKDTIILSNIGSKSYLIQIINTFVSSNTENKVSMFAKPGNTENEISCVSSFYNIIENGRQRGYGVSLFGLICIGPEGMITLAYIIQVTIYSKNNNEDIHDFQIKYLLLWNNKDDSVYKYIDGIDITQMFKDCFLKPIFENKMVPLQSPQINTSSASGGVYNNSYQGLSNHEGVPILGGKNNKTNTKKNIRKYKK